MVFETCKNLTDYLCARSDGLAWPAFHPHQFTKGIVYMRSMQAVRLVCGARF
jgi:hypothetical protein